MPIHLKKALENGATRDQIVEARRGPDARRGAFHFLLERQEAVMADDTTRQSPPKEGRNCGYDTDHQRTNISGTLSIRHKGDSDNSDDESSGNAEEGGIRVSTEGRSNPQE